MVESGKDPRWRSEGTHLHTWRYFDGDKYTAFFFREKTGAYESFEGNGYTSVSDNSTVYFFQLNPYFEFLNKQNGSLERVYPFKIIH